MNEQDAATIATAEEFAREQDAIAAKRAFDMGVRQESLRHGRVLAVIWAPVVALVLLGFMALIGFVVHQVSTEHAARQHDKDMQVTVWCYADPHSDRGTSSFTGLPAQVRGLCPDAQLPAYGTNP